MNRWSIYVDIEGFTPIFKDNEDQAIFLLGKLIEYIWKIGSGVYYNETQRLFIHQYGDGFVIVSNGYEEDIIRPICISIFLMQIMLINNGTARIGISEGSFQDILSCYPECVRKEAHRSNENSRCTGGLQVGAGIMKFQQVMGSTFVNAVALNNITKKGPLLLIDALFRNRFNSQGINILYENENYLEIDWIHSNNSELERIYGTLSIDKPASSELERNLRQYIQNNDLHQDWIINSNIIIGN